MGAVLAVFVAIVMVVAKQLADILWWLFGINRIKVKCNIYHYVIASW